MNREDIIRMAWEAGFEELFKDSHDWVCFTEEIERFFQAAYAAGAAAEREACARVCEEDGLLWGQRYAAAISARRKA